MPATIVKHKRCGEPVSIAVLLHDEAIYVYCYKCHDIVECDDMDLPDAVKPGDDRFYVIYSDGEGRPM